MTSSTTRNGLILAIVCLAQFMVTLDLAIVNVALPSIQRDLGLGESTLQWVVVAYGLTLGGFLLLGGRLGDLFGRRRVFLSGLALFTGASLVAGLAQSAAELIGARAVEGFGAALLVPSALSILAVTFAEGASRNRALGLFGAVAASSASVGVIASGLLTEGPGWRWVFFINIPIGLALIAAALRLLPVAGAIERVRQYDAAGATSVTAGLLALVYGLNRGAEYGWRALPTLGLFAASAVLLGAFVAIESRTREPLVPGAILRNRTMVAADLAGFFSNAAFLSFIFLGSLLMQQVVGYSPVRTGSAWLATSLTGFIAAGVAGTRLVVMMGLRRLLFAALALLTVGAAWLIRVPAGAAYASDLLPALLVVGIAIGLIFPAIQIGALSGAAGRTVGLASGLAGMMQEVGGAVGVAVVSTALVSRGKDAGVLSGFHAAFLVIAGVAAIGALVAAVAFPAAQPELAPAPASARPVVLESGSSD